MTSKHSPSHIGAYNGKENNAGDVFYLHFWGRWLDVFVKLPRKQVSHLAVFSADAHTHVNQVTFLFLHSCHQCHLIMSATTPNNNIFCLQINLTFLGSFLQIGEVVCVSRTNFEERHVELMEELHRHLNTEKG